LEGGECGPAGRGNGSRLQGELIGVKAKVFNFYASLGSKTQAVSKKLKTLKFETLLNE